MGFSSTLSKYEPQAYAAFRIIFGFLIIWHGTDKLFGFPTGHQVPVGSQFWIGGVIELVGGVLVMVGLFTRIAAFLLAGTMAVAYFQFHWKLSFANKAFLPIVNHGELAVAMCFAFLLIAARGPGPWALDNKRA
jgi:putative oxidoreductase